VNFRGDQGEDSPLAAVGVKLLVIHPD